MPCQQQDILASLAQGRQVQRYGVQAVKQVLTEGSRLNAGFQIGVRGRHNPHINLVCLGGTHSGHLALFNHRKQLLLHQGRQVANLVQEQGAAIGLFHTPLLCGGGAGEGSLFMTEEFALEQGFRNAAHVNGHHSLAVSGGKAMQFVRHHILSRTVLAGDQHIGVCGGNAGNLFLQRADTFRLANESACVVIMPCVSVGQSGTAQVHSGMHGIQHSLLVPGLGNEVHRSGLDGTHGLFRAGEGGDEQHNGFRVNLQNLLQTGIPFLSAHGILAEVHVQEDDVGLEVLHKLGHAFRRAQHPHRFHPRLQQHVQ